MTILQSKSSQQGDSDDAPPKKKLKKCKNLVRSQVPSLAANHPTPSSAPGPSRRNDQRDLYSYLSAPSSYFPPEPEPSQYLQTGQVIHKFKLDKFDVPIAPRPTPSSPPFSYPEFNAAGPSNVGKSSYDFTNPDCLEYYIYGPWSRSPNSKSCRSAPKRPLPDEDLIEVISSEEIVGRPVVVEPAPPSDAGSLLDDINNFDFDDKFGELERFQQDAIWEDTKLHNVEQSCDQAVSLHVSPMNGYQKINQADSQYTVRSSHSSPAASLTNLGNTCFLNSVLYTLRFAPNFLHNLHHLVNDMNVNSTTDTIAKRTASLGRNLSLSLMTNKKKDKEVSTGAGDLTATVKTKKQIVTEKLHGVYEAMRAAEARDNPDAFHPDVFLTALREVNPIFEGNQQQDAHELLVCLLDIFRETCHASARQAETRAAFEANAQSSNLVGAGVDRGNVKKISWTSRFSKTLERKNKKNAAMNAACQSAINVERSDTAIQGVAEEMGGDTETPLSTPLHSYPHSYNNFVAHDFEGVMVLRTTCMECENTTEKNEPFADICVPIKTDVNEDNDDDSHPGGSAQNPSELYQRAVVTDEFLRDRNKYYCEECQRYNEARRSVSYHRLPRLLTLQLKRFSSTFGAMSKVTKYMPTPMTLACFCEDCIEMKDVGGARHGYELYGVIMHLGPNMAGGHYIAYVRMSDNNLVYRQCPRDRFLNAQEPVKPKFNLFNKPTPLVQPPNGITRPPVCGSLDCCGIRLPEPELLGKYDVDSPWLVCDDDLVKVLSASEVETLLSKNSTSNATPYLLFYARKND